MLPSWLLPSVASVREEADVRPRELFSLADEDALDQDASDEARLAALVANHIQTQGVLVWGELSSVARSLSFPSTLGELAVAYPLRVPLDATQAQLDAIYAVATARNEATIENQQAQAQLIVKNLVIAKLHYSINGDEAKERAKNYYITAQTLLSALKKQVLKIRRDYQSNALDPFF